MAEDDGKAMSHDSAIRGVAYHIHGITEWAVGMAREDFDKLCIREHQINLVSCLLNASSDITSADLVRIASLISTTDEEPPCTDDEL